MTVVVAKDTITTQFRTSIEDASPAATRRLVKNLGVLGLAALMRGFEEQRDPLGRPWRAHSVMTIARRNARGRGTNRIFAWRILQNDGTLRASVSPGRARVGRINDPTRIEAPGWASSARGAVRRATDSLVEFGTNLIYGIAHQFGLRRREATVRAHTRKIEHRNIYGLAFTKSGKTHKTRHGRISGVGVAFVRAHKTTLPAVPARPFIGLSAQLIAQVMETIRMTFWRNRGGTR